MVVSEVCVKGNGTQLMENPAVTGLQADSIDCYVPFLLRDQRSDPSGVTEVTQKSRMRLQPQAT